jgi:hypothetical protein
MRRSELAGTNHSVALEKWRKDHETLCAMEEPLCEVKTTAL